MNRRLFFFIPLFLLTTIMLSGQMEKPENDTLVVLWVSGDRDVAEKSCLMYTHAAKKYEWFSEVILIIWGPSARLTVEDEAIGEKVKKMQEDGVILEACIACSNMLGVTDELKELGIDVKGMGGPLTKYLKGDYKILSY
jgi:hypothetical protein